MDEARARDCLGEDGHSFNVLCEAASGEPLTVNCWVCGAIWRISDRAPRREDDYIGRMGWE